MRLIEQGEAQAWGGFEIHEPDPPVRERTDVYYLPFVEDGCWGVFDADNNIVFSTVDRVLPQQVMLGQIIVSNILPGDVTEHLPEGPDYVYGGRYADHFGHFIIESLPRLWPLAEEGLRPGQKLVMHGPATPVDWWRHEYVREIFGALNIGPEDIVHSDRPFWIKKLTIPRPAFAAQDYAHHAFGRLCRSIGARLLEDCEPSREWRPAYCSKTRLAHGVRRFVNEQAVVDVMTAAGVEIFHLQQMNFREQLKLIKSRNVVAGPAMSGHHISVFTGDACRFEVLNYVPIVNSNFFLIDRLNENRARYHLPEGVQAIDPAEPTFIVSYALEEPEAVARELLKKL